jgi:uncharacterized protein (TIGR00251 family)
MKINIKVIAGAKKNLIKKENDSYKVYVRTPATEGRANKAVISLLAEYLGVKTNQISLLSGLHSARKVVEIK